MIQNSVNQMLYTAGLAGGFARRERIAAGKENLEAAKEEYNTTMTNLKNWKEQGVLDSDVEAKENKEALDKLKSTTEKYNNAFTPKELSRAGSSMYNKASYMQQQEGMLNAALAAKRQLAMQNSALKNQAAQEQANDNNIVNWDLVNRPAEEKPVNTPGSIRKELANNDKEKKLAEEAKKKGIAERDFGI